MPAFSKRRPTAKRSQWMWIHDGNSTEACCRFSCRKDAGGGHSGDQPFASGGTGGLVAVSRRMQHGVATRQVVTREVSPALLQGYNDRHTGCQFILAMLPSESDLQAGSSGCVGLFRNEGPQRKRPSPRLARGERQLSWSANRLRMRRPVRFRQQRHRESPRSCWSAWSRRAAVPPWSPECDSPGKRCSFHRWWRSSRQR